MRNSRQTLTADPTAEFATLIKADSALVGGLVPSPSYGDRRGRAIDALILHYTGMASGEAALARLCDPASQVSCHYLVWQDGRVDQLVAEADRAWHAGRSFWAGETDMNSVSVGIEIVNGGHDFGLPLFPPVQVEAVAALGKDLCSRHGIPAGRVLAHSDIAPDRKLDPGERFPWRALAAAGVGLWAEPEIEDASSEADNRILVALQAGLVRFGYLCPTSGMLDQATRDAITAFQRHWRPTRVDGIADRSTLSVLSAIAAQAGHR